MSLFRKEVTVALQLEHALKMDYDEEDFIVKDNEEEEDNVEDEDYDEELEENDGELEGILEDYFQGGNVDLKYFNCSKNKRTSSFGRTDSVIG